MTKSVLVLLLLIAALVLLVLATVGVFVSSPWVAIIVVMVAMIIDRLPA
jgi:hypothetical protein